MGKFLVNLDLREGLVKCIILHKGNFSFTQQLDYQGIPFKCNQCHSYGHVVVDCTLSFKRKVWEGKKDIVKMQNDI